MGSIWLVIVGGGILTLLIRLSFIGLMDRWKPPGLLIQALRFVPPAVLCAIIFPEVLIREGDLHLTLMNDRLWAAIAAVLVGWKTRNTLLTIAVGMVVLLVFQQF